MKRKRHFTAMFIALGVIVVFCLVLLAYGLMGNKVHNAEQSVYDAYFTLSSDLDARDVLTKDVLSLVNTYFKDQNDLTVTLNDSCNNVAGSLNISDRIDAENILSEGIYTFRELSLNNAKIKKDKRYTLLIANLDENNTKIKTDMVNFNTKAEAFNKIISRFPYSFIAKMNSLSQIPSLKDVTVPQAPAVTQKTTK